MSASSISAADLPGLNPADDFSFRNGQYAFLIKLVKAYQEGKTDHLGVFVPGYGKTLTALSSFAVARAMGVADRLVVFVPRGNLRDQYADQEEMGRMLRWIGAPPMQFCVADSSRVFLKNPIPIVIATYQYTCGESGNRSLQRYCQGGSPLFVLDEIHHLPEQSAWSRAVGRLPYDSLIGLSGTPLRSDGKPLFGVPHETVTTESGHEQLQYKALHEVSLRGAHAEGGILKRIEAHVVDYTITMVEEDTGEEVEFTLAELQEEVGRDTSHLDQFFARKSLRFHDVYLDTLLGPAIGRLQEKRASLFGAEDDVRNHQMLVTCMSNRHAADVLDFIDRRYSWFSATRIGQDVPREEREKRLDAYRNGEVDIMVQVDMIGEGTDIKTISVIAKLDLVSARSKTLQQIFRGMRYYDAWSEEANVCDVFTSGDLGLSQTLDWMTREVKAGLRRRTQDGQTPPEKATEDSERSEWALTGVDESEIETHSLELEDTGGNSNLRVQRQPFERPDPDSLDVSAQEDDLRKECATLANRLARTLQDRGMDVHVRDVHAKAKERFHKPQSDMSLKLLKRKKQWLKRCLQMKRLR
ncbi:MAG: helicase [Bacteroidetes bacterium QH_7_62_13]|nr:MAG: helicase [Bacteroidetes bacterium QH_7_62_13]